MTGIPMKYNDFAIKFRCVFNAFSLIFDILFYSEIVKMILDNNLFLFSFDFELFVMK